MHIIKIINLSAIGLLGIMSGFSVQAQSPFSNQFSSLFTNANSEVMGGGKLFGSGSGSSGGRVFSGISYGDQGAIGEVGGVSYADLTSSFNGWGIQTGGSQSVVSAGNLSSQLFVLEGNSTTVTRGISQGPAQFAAQGTSEYLGSFGSEGLFEKSLLSTTQAEVSSRNNGFAEAFSYTEASIYKSGFDSSGLDMMP